MKIIPFVFCSLALLLIPAAKACAQILPVPSHEANAAQEAMIERKYGMFIHFGINTFHNMEWTDGSKPASSYKPSDIDAEQWVKTARDAGMKYIILVTKHHEGFCLWDSKYTEYDVGSSPNKTNVIEEVAKACKKHRIGLGLYYSLWDRSKNGNGYKGKNGFSGYKINPELDSMYNAYMLKQIDELLDITEPFTDIVEFWFDGGWTKENHRWPVHELYQSIKSRQPGCQIGINWSIGLPEDPDYHAVRPEEQKEGYPIRYFPSDFRLGDPLIPANPDPKVFRHEGQEYYMPWESTVCMSKKWFYHTKDKSYKSLDELAELYRIATAQDNVLILNSPPDREGRLREADVKLLLALKKKLNLETVPAVWKGFDRLDFSFEEREVRLIIPVQPLPGNPWIWRARFPDWHTGADSILVSQGFHLAYINTDNLYGSPEAIRIWNRFYAFITEEYRLHKKVSLMGASRGGLFIYNWGKQNPEKVSCIYAEAPVCDIKSWPGGKGEGKGSSRDWKLLKKAYGFSSEKEALNYRNNPVDNLDALAEHKIPILHMIGLNDRIVPPEENTYTLINKYLRLGGTATVVPCTEGEHRLEGHHFDIETPGLVADFIKYATLPHLPLSSAAYHELQGGLQNSRIVFEQEKKGRVAFLGGSITFNSGWRDSVYAYLQNRFPDTDFEFVAAGIPSMGTTPGAFRLERDVLSKGKIDLLFEEAAVNDATNGRTEREQIRAMEGIIRHCRKSNPEMDIVMMHFVDPDKMKSYNKGDEPAVITHHTRVAAHYNIPVINLAREVTDRINRGEFSWEDDFKDLHPSPFGQGVYAASMVSFLENAYADEPEAEQRPHEHCLPDMLDTFSYENGRLIDAARVEIPEGWRMDQAWIPVDGTGTRPNFTDVPMLIGSTPGQGPKLKFTGSAVGIAVAAGQDAAVIEYRIDGSDWMRLDLLTPWSKHLHLPWYYTLEAELDHAEHLLELRLAELPDGSNEGRFCRIRYFYINETF